MHAVFTQTHKMGHPPPVLLTHLDRAGGHVGRFAVDLPAFQQGLAEIPHPNQIALGGDSLVGRRVAIHERSKRQWRVEAQAQLEKEGALKQRRLGQLGSVETGTASDSDDSDDEAEERPAAKEKE